MSVTWILILSVYLSAVFAREPTLEEKHDIRVFNNNHGHEKPVLAMDEGWMTLNNSMTFDIMFYAQSHECWKCEIMYIDTLPALTMKTFIVNATYRTNVEVRRAFGNRARLCSFTERFKENGDYWVFTETSGNATSCSLVMANNPMAAEMPILYAAAGLLGLWIVIKAIFYLYRRSRSKKKEQKNGLPSTTGDIPMQTDGEATKPEDKSAPTPSKRQRLKCLDTFRGLSLIIMIFVNYGGGGYWFFDHAPWNGLTIADLVFPWFVFIMGTSINYSFKGMFKRNTSRFFILVKVFKRALLLFAFGIILNTNWGPVDLDHIRIPGVLQRLSLSYLFVAGLEVIFAKKRCRTCWSQGRDLIPYIPEWILHLGILAGYLYLTFGLEVPGCPTGYIGPGGIHEGKKYENCTGGAAGYIDRLVLGDNHIYGNPTPKKIYQTIAPFDPEGILGTLPSIFLCFLGLQAGRIFVTYKDTTGRILRLIIWMAVTGAIGAGLCACSKNEGVIPLNKNLWSVSFVMITACFGYFLLGVLFLVIDVFNIWNGSPFVFTGMNPLVIYLCHDIFYRFFPVNWVVDPIHWKLLLKAIWDVAIWVTLAFILYCKRVFIAL